MNNRKIGALLSYIMMVFEVLSTLLLTPFIIRTLGQAEYGVYKLSSAIIAYLLLLDLGIGNSIVRYIAKFRTTGEHDQERRFLGVAILYYSGVAIISVIAGIVLIALFPTVFAKGLSPEEIALAQKLLSITMINTAVTLGTAVFVNIITAYERFAFSKGISIIQIILRMILTVVALKIGMGSVGIVTVNLAMTVFSRLLFILYVLFKIKLRPLFSGIKFEFIKEIIIYSSFILLQMIATQINAFADQVLLGIFVSSSSVIIAVYGVGSQIVQYFQSIGTGVTGVLMPGVVKMVEKKASAEQLTAEMVRIGRFIFMMLSIIWVCFLIYGRQFIELWAGKENSDGYYVAIILMAAYTFILTESIGGQILWAMNAHKEQSIIKICIVVVNVFLTIALIRWNPLVGATIGTFISLVLGDVVLMNLIFKKKIKIRLLDYYHGLFKGILPSLILSMISGILFNLLHLSGWGGWILNVLVMVCVYGICMIAFGFNTYEKSLLLGTVKKLAKKLHRRKAKQNEQI